MFGWGLFITAMAIGHIWGEAVGWLVLGIGLMGVGILRYLNGAEGPMIYIGDDEEKYKTAGFGVLLRK